MPTTVNVLGHRVEHDNGDDGDAIRELIDWISDGDADVSSVTRRADELAARLSQAVVRVAVTDTSGSAWLMTISRDGKTVDYLESDAETDEGIDVPVATRVDAELVESVLTKQYGSESVVADGDSVVINLYQDDVESACAIASIVGQLATSRPAPIQLVIGPNRCFAHLEPKKGARFKAEALTAATPEIVDDWRKTGGVAPLVLPDGLLATKIPSKLRRPKGRPRPAPRDEEKPLTTGSHRDRMRSVRGLLKVKGWSRMFIDALVDEANQDECFEELRGELYGHLARLDRDDIREFLWERIQNEQSDKAANVIAYHMWRHDKLLERIPKAIGGSSNVQVIRRLLKANREAGKPHRREWTDKLERLQTSD